MTSRKMKQRRAIGDLIKKHRLCLTDLPRFRQGFIDDRSQKYFDYEDWISEKTLSNYENGKNIPHREYLCNLFIVCEIDELEFVRNIGLVMMGVYFLIFFTIIFIQLDMYVIIGVYNPREIASFLGDCSLWACSLKL